MPDSPPSPDADTKTVEDTGVAPGRGPTPGTPRWVKVSGVIALVVILLFVILLLAGGRHGPGRHTGGAGGHAPPAGDRAQR